MSRTFGVEIEMIELGRTQIAEVVNSFVLGSAREVVNANDTNESIWEIMKSEESIWTVLDDDTLDAPIDRRGELVTPKLVESDLALLGMIAAALGREGATVNESCGLHIHVGIPTTNVEDFNRLVEVVEKWEPAILATILPSRRRFAQPLDRELLAAFHTRRPATLDQFWTLWYKDPNWRQRRDRYDDVRYRGLNLHCYRRLQTVEFRYFNGTLDPDLILAHVRECIGVVERAGFSPCEVAT